MNLTEDFRNKIIEEFKKLPKNKQEKLEEKECMDLDIEDFVYEDYAYVLYFAYNILHIKTGRAIVYCGKCKEEFEVDVNTDTFEYTCPKCGKVNNQ